MCLVINFDNIESLKVIVGHRDIHSVKKNFNYFRCVVVRILVEK